MVLTIIVTTLAACGVLLILWTAVDALRRPYFDETAYYVIMLHGDGGKVERSIRSAFALRERQGLQAMLVFVDNGIEPEGQIAANLLLCNQNDAILCAKSQLPEIIGTENKGIGAGTD